MLTLLEGLVFHNQGVGGPRVETGEQHGVCRVQGGAVGPCSVTGRDVIECSHDGGLDGRVGDPPLHSRTVYG